MPRGSGGLVRSLLKSAWSALPLPAWPAVGPGSRPRSCPIGHRYCRKVITLLTPRRDPICHLAGGAVQQGGEQPAGEVPGGTQRIVIELVVVRAGESIIQSLEFLGEHMAIPGETLLWRLVMTSQRSAQFSHKPHRSGSVTVCCSDNFAKAVPKSPQFSLSRCPFGRRAELFIKLRRSRHETTAHL